MNLPLARPATKAKACLLWLCVLILTAALPACKARTYSTQPTAYYVVYSGIASDDARIEGIDSAGQRTVMHRIRATDITKSALVGDEWVAGGHRANNHLIMRQDGSFEEFHLLREPRYSGVWAITLDGASVISVMNGNVDTDRNVYSNLLVIQDRQQTVLTQKEIDITPNTLWVQGDEVYMGGCYWQYDVTPNYCGAAIARYNITTGRYTVQHFPYNAGEITATEYKTVVRQGDRLYALLNESLTDKDAGSRQNKLDILDSETLERVDTVTFDCTVRDIALADDSLYIVAADQICRYDPLTRAAQPLYTLPPDGDLRSIQVRQGHLYCLVTASAGQGAAPLGYILDLCTASGGVKATPLTTDTKHTDCIVFFPLGIS